MPAKTLFRRWLTQAFRTRPTAPIRKRRNAIGQAFDLLEDRAVPAATLVADLNTQPDLQGINPETFVQIGSATFFIKTTRPNRAHSG